MSFEEMIKKILHDVFVYWRTIVLIVAPFALLPLPILLPSSATNCGYVILLMAVYWVTEVLPLAVTALLPLVLLPVLGIVPGKTVAGLYIADSSIIFIGGLMMALAIERCNLHKRIGLGILVLLGSSPSRVLIGFMLPTWFLSMWISNTATTAMMVPVVEAVIVQMREGIQKKRTERLTRETAIFQLEEANRKQKETGCNHGYTEEENLESTYFGVEANAFQFGNDVSSPMNLNPLNLPRLLRSPRSLRKSQEKGEEVEKGGQDGESEIVTTSEDTVSIVTSVDDNRGNEDDEEEEKANEDKWMKNFAKMICLAVAYSSNVGGTATLTGTPPNLLVAQTVERIWGSHGLPTPLTYTTWMFFGFPHAILCLILTWAWLQLIFICWRSFFFCCVKDKKVVHDENGVSAKLRREYDELGKISFGEVSAISLLVAMVLLWFARDPGFAAGYGSLFKAGYVTDAVPAIFIATLLFVWPSQRPAWLCLRPSNEKAKTVPPLLDWKTVSSKLPWGPIILIGGGFALAKGCDDSGLSEVIGEQLSGLKAIPMWAIAVIVTTMVAFLTEITSNVAVIALILPILEAMSNDLGINPLYLMLPAGMASSYAFMLPIATPPNAIVFSYGHLNIISMASVGVMCNILCIFIVSLGINTWGIGIFNLNEVPWTVENIQNITTRSF